MWKWAENICSLTPPNKVNYKNIWWKIKKIYKVKVSLFVLNVEFVLRTSTSCLRMIFGRPLFAGFVFWLGKDLAFFEKIFPPELPHCCWFSFLLICLFMVSFSFVISLKIKICILMNFMNLLPCVRVRLFSFLSWWVSYIVVNLDLCNDSSW